MIDKKDKPQTQDDAARDRNPAGTPSDGLYTDAGATGRTEAMRGSGRIEDVPGFTGTGSQGSTGGRKRSGVDEQAED